jgi:hypothetical protein
MLLFLICLICLTLQIYKTYLVQSKFFINYFKNMFFKINLVL